jgi:chromosome segregation ATPase
MSVPVDSPLSQADDPLPAGHGETQREKDALRIQVAAVAAQQTALTEDEFRLEQRRQALDRHEQQLALHLEEKRSKLVALRDEARTSHQLLRRERALFEKRVANILHRLNLKRNETLANHRQVQIDRRRLLSLRERLKKRHHRYWADERAKLGHLIDEVAGREKILEKEQERLRNEHAAAAQAQLHANAEIEIARRQLQEERDRLRLQEEEFLERVRDCAMRETELDEAERQLSAEMASWHRTRAVLDKEAEGLETRIGHYRQALQQKEQELARLDGRLRKLHTDGTLASQSASCLTSSRPPPIPAVSVPTNSIERGQTPANFDTAPSDRVESLEKLAVELADQRLYVAEHHARLLNARHDLERDHRAITREIDALTRSLEQREQTVWAKEQALNRNESALGRRTEELATMRRQLEGWQAQITSDASAWATEHARASAELRSSQQSADQQRTLLTAIRERWHERRRSQLVRLRKITASYQELRRDCFVQREQWLQRRLILDQEQRSLAERALAMEQFRQECIVRAHNPKAAEKRLEHLRRRCAAAYALAERTLAKERQHLANETNRVEHQSRELEQQAYDLHAQMTEFSDRQSTSEEQEAYVETERSKLLAEAESLRSQRAQYEHQLRTLQDEVERLARQLMDDGERGLEPFNQAA